LPPADGRGLVPPGSARGSGHRSQWSCREVLRARDRDRQRTRRSQVGGVAVAVAVAASSTRGRLARYPRRIRRGVSSRGISRRGITCIAADRTTWPDAGGDLSWFQRRGTRYEPISQ
jgi:hypothetical protein